MTEIPAANAALLDAIAFDANGLVAAIAQQHDTGEVLMMAWMNADAVRETLATGQVCYFSRSRGKLWRKGETSGQAQRLIELRMDCDGDALLVLVDQPGGGLPHRPPRLFFSRRPAGRMARGRRSQNLTDIVIRRTLRWAAARSINRRNSAQFCGVARHGRWWRHAGTGVQSHEIRRSDDTGGRAVGRLRQLGDTARVPQNQYGGPVMNQTDAIATASWALKDPATTRGNPELAARAIAAEDWLAGQWQLTNDFGMYAPVNQVLWVQFRQDVRTAIGVAPGTPSQVVVDRLLATADALRAGAPDPGAPLQPPARSRSARKAR